MKYNVVKLFGVDLLPSPYIKNPEAFVSYEALARFESLDKVLQPIKNVTKEELVQLYLESDKKL